MWQSINNGNWKIVENAVRRTAGSLGDLEVWTGGLDVLKLSGREIFLAVDQKTNKRVMPTPNLLFKLVYSKPNHEAIVFITINNPYIKSSELDETNLICKNEFDRCKNNAKFKDLVKGYTYCCLYEDFIKHPLVSKIGIPNHFKNLKPLEKIQL